MRQGHGVDLLRQRPRSQAFLQPATQVGAPLQLPAPAYGAPVPAYAHLPAHTHSAPFNAPQAVAAQGQQASPRASVARLFFDLRQALGQTAHFVAAQLVTEPDVIDALEMGAFERLPDWAETSRVVLGYTALAGIDGTPVLRAIDEILRREAVPQAQRFEPRNAYEASPFSGQAAPQRQPHGGNAGHAHHSHHGGLPVGRMLHDAGAALAHGAKRLPADALMQVRKRPDRALYALSVPLLLLILALNTSVVRTAFSYVPRPAAEIVRDMKMYFQVQFAPVRDGLRWIDVDNPRDRRGDKLRRKGQSD